MTAIPSTGMRLPAGVRDFLPRAAARRRGIAERLLAKFEAWGYARIITPVFERAEVLDRGNQRWDDQRGPGGVGSVGEAAASSLIRFVEPGSGEVVALRPDITPQIARIAATRMRVEDGPLRFCYEGAVHRDDAGPRGEREILQAGIELIGVPAPFGDAEALALAAEAISVSELRHARLDVGHAAPLRSVFEALADVKDTAVRHRVHAALAKKDRGAVEAALAGQPKAVRERAAQLATLFGPADEVLARAGQVKWPRDVVTALAELAEILDQARALMPGDIGQHLSMDLGDVRGVGYYTGLRFAGYAAGVGDAIIRGGRYDDLIGRYGRSTPAIGFAVEIESIAQAQRAQGIDGPAPRAGVLVTAPSVQFAAASKFATVVRGHGVRVAVDLAPSTRDVSMQWARAGGYALLVVFDKRGALVFDPLTAATVSLDAGKGRGNASSASLLGIVARALETKRSP